MDEPKTYTDVVKRFVAEKTAAAEAKIAAETARLEKARRVEAENMRRKKQAQILQHFKTMVRHCCLETVNKVYEKARAAGDDIPVPREELLLALFFQKQIVETLMDELTNGRTDPWKQFLRGVPLETCKSLITGAVANYARDGYPADVKAWEKMRKAREDWYKGACFYREHSYTEDQWGQWRDDYGLYD